MAWAVHLASVCLSFVLLLHPTQRVESLGNIFAPLNSLETQTFCVKILGKNLRGSRGLCKFNTRGDEKLVFLTNISLYFENGTRYSHSYNGRHTGTRM